MIKCRALKYMSSPHPTITTDIWITFPICCETWTLTASALTFSTVAAPESVFAALRTPIRGKISSSWWAMTSIWCYARIFRSSIIKARHRIDHSVSCKILHLAPIRKLTRNTFHSMCHLKDKDTAFHKQIHTHKDYTVDKVDLSSLKFASWWNDNQWTSKYTSNDELCLSS